MSRALAVALAEDPRFAAWVTVARARNDYGTPCATAAECAAAPPALHMWHHEDAGVSYNAWRVLTSIIARQSGEGTPAGGGPAGQPAIHLVHLPEKGWFWPWFNQDSFARPGMSAKAIVVHKVGPALYPAVHAAWDVATPLPAVVADCSQSCAEWGWSRARVACEAPPPLPAEAGRWRGYVPRWNGTMCPLTPARHFRCCFLREATPADLARAV